MLKNDYMVKVTAMCCCSALQMITFDVGLLKYNERSEANASRAVVNALGDLNRISTYSHQQFKKVSKLI